MHSGSREIVVIAHADNIGVGELVIEKWVGERAIAIVAVAVIADSISTIIN